MGYEQLKVEEKLLFRLYQAICQKAIEFYGLKQNNINDLEGDGVIYQEPKARPQLK